VRGGDAGGAAGVEDAAGLDQRGEEPCLAGFGERVVALAVGGDVRRCRRSVGGVGFVETVGHGWLLAIRRSQPVISGAAM
jgi:hypothetical protein